MLYLFALVFVSFVQDMSAMEYICNRNDHCGCSRRPVKKARIFGGKTALHDSWSWTISIQNGNNHLCGGSILNERYIITAAHCLVDKMNRLSNITVCAGTNRLSDTCHQRHEIQTIINHPSYNSKTFENDISLIQVKVPFNFTDTSIARICLPNKARYDRYPKTGTDVIAVGWGRNEAGQQSDTLQQVTIQIVGEFTDTCNDVLKNRLLQLCAGAPEKDTCQGDSGGPLMLFTDSKQWELVGITSYGRGYDCATEYPGVYTRITAFLTWIQQIVNSTSPQPSSHRCSCECPRGSNPSTAYTSVYTAFACVDACKAVRTNPCNSSNTYACLETNCAYSTSTGYSLTGNSPNIEVFTWSNGDRYEGEFKDGKMHGKGTLNFADGEKYIGDWIEGKRTGRGVFTWPNGERYEGEFHHDVITGRGIYTWPDGDRYDGQFKDGKKHRTGTYNYANGEKYTGDWIENKRTGRGIFNWPNHDRYEGEFKDGKKHGTGTIKFANGEKYTGNWIENKRTGLGVFTWPNGDRYEGEFHHDVITGRGIYTWPDGDRYDGQFKDGKKHGTGTYNYANGEKYTGDWIENKRTGRGIFNWPNHDRYEGEFKDGKKHGTGTIKFANGEKYIGNWIENKRTGRGVFNWPNGDRYEGEFKDNEMHGTGKMIYANGKVTHGRWSNNVFVS